MEKDNKNNKPNNQTGNKNQRSKKKSNARGKQFKNNIRNDVNHNNFQDAAFEQEKDKFSHSRVEANNAPTWYFKDKRILADVASYSFNKPLGTNLNPNDIYTGKIVAQPFSTIPGVLSIILGLTPGVAVDASSPINLGAQNVYSYVRYKNSGAHNYDPQDLMLYLIAMDSLYSAWNWMKRIYGYASTYSTQNKYKPEAYAAADNVDLQDIYNNLADFRAYLNMASSRISAFCVPATMTYFVRHSWLFSNIYADSNQRKAQSYMYTPAYFYTYSETSSEAGGELTPINMAYVSGNPKWTFSSLKTLLNTLINNLQYSEDIGTMSGDILKAYGEGNLFTLSTFDPDYKIDAVYSAEVLSQIENANMLLLSASARTASNLTQFKITQDPNQNWIKFQPVLAMPSSVSPRNGMFLNMHMDNPDPESVMVATRLNYTGQNTGTSSAPTFTLTSCGSELAIGAEIFYYSQGNSFTTASAHGAQLTLAKWIFEEPVIDLTMTAETAGKVYLAFWLLNAFDWSPYIMGRYRLGTANSDGNVVMLTPPFRDWDTYTALDQQDVEAMNELALLTEFNIPN